MAKREKVEKADKKIKEIKQKEGQLNVKLQKNIQKIGNLIEYIVQ